MSPVVVGVGDVFIPLARSAHSGVEVREVTTWESEDGNEDDPARKEEEKNADGSPGGVIADVAPPVAEDHFASQDKEEGENREEVSEADIQIARDAQIAIERDEGEHHVFGDMRVEGMRDDARPAFSLFAILSRDFENAPESVDKTEAEESEKGKCRLHQENGGEIERSSLIGDFAQEEIGVSARDAREDHEDAKEIVRERFHKGDLAHSDDGGFGEASHGSIIGEDGASDFLRGFCRHIPDIGNIERPDSDETHDNGDGEF